MGPGRLSSLPWLPAGDLSRGPADGDVERGGICRPGDCHSQKSGVVSVRLALLILIISTIVLE